MLSPTRLLSIERISFKVSVSAERRRCVLVYWYRRALYPSRLMQGVFFLFSFNCGVHGYDQLAIPARTYSRLELVPTHLSIQVYLSSGTRRCSVSYIVIQWNMIYRGCSVPRRRRGGEWYLAARNMQCIHTTKLEMFLCPRIALRPALRHRLAEPLPQTRIIYHR